jgi:hypothetical protein
MNKFAERPFTTLALRNLTFEDKAFLFIKAPYSKRIKSN